MQMRTLARSAVAASALALVALVAAPANAATYTVAAKHNGVTKATASWERGIDELCVNLVAGYSATAIINGNSITDYSANGTQSCMWVNNTSDNSNYSLIIRWNGTGGAFETNQTSVLG